MRWKIWAALAALAAIVAGAIYDWNDHRSSGLQTDCYRGDLAMPCKVSGRPQRTWDGAR